MALLDVLPTVLLVGLVGLVFLAYVVAPAVVRSRFRHDVRTVLEEVPSEEVPPAVAAWLDERAHELASFGYEDLGRFRLEPTAGHVTWSALLRNDAARDLALAGVARGTAVPEGAPVMQLAQVEICTRWPSGRALQTSTLADPLAVDPLPEHELLQVPMIECAEQLVGIHTTRVARRRGWGTPELPRRGEEPRAVSDAMVRLMDHQVERGLLRREPDAWRATWRGAYVMSWRLLFPLKQLARRAIHRRAERELVELGVLR